MESAATDVLSSVAETGSENLEVIPIAPCDDRQAGPRPDDWRHWVIVRWPALVALAVAAPITFASLQATRGWSRRPFPGFFVGGNALVGGFGLPSWTGMRAQVPSLARIANVDGRPVRRGEDVYQRVAELPVGTPMRYDFIMGGRSVSRVVPTMRFSARDYWLTFGVLSVFAVLAISTGIVVAVLQPHTASARAFLIQSVATGLFVVTAIALYHPDWWWLSAIHLLTLAVYPGAFIHLGLTFPVEHPLVLRHRRLLVAPYVVATGFAAPLAATFYVWPPWTAPIAAFFAFNAIAILAVGVLLARAYRENRTPLVRARIKAVLPGFAIVATVATIVSLGLVGIIGDMPLGGTVVAVTAVFSYLAVGYAIARHDLLDLDALLKQTLVYAVLTVSITAAYAGTLVVLGLLLPSRLLRASAVFNVAFVVLMASLFEPVRAAVQRVVDRTFYRARLDYRRTVHAMSAALTSLLDLTEILDRVGRTVTEGLQLHGSAVVLWNDLCELWRYDVDARRMVQVEACSFDALRRQLGTGLSGSAVADGDSHCVPPCVSRLATDDAARELRTLGAGLVVPMARGADVIGAFALGARRSGAVLHQRRPGSARHLGRAKRGRHPERPFLS